MAIDNYYDYPGTSWESPMAKPTEAIDIERPRCTLIKNLRFFYSDKLNYGAVYAVGTPQLDEEQAGRLRTLFHPSVMPWATMSVEYLVAPWKELTYAEVLKRIGSISIMRKDF